MRAATDSAEQSMEGLVAELLDKSARDNKPIADDPEPSPPAAMLRAAIAGKWQIPLFAAGLVVLLTGLPRLHRPQQADPTGKMILAQARQALADGKPAAAVELADRVSAMAGPSDEREQVLLVQIAARHQLADAALDRRQRDIARKLLDDVGLLVSLHGGIDKVPHEIINPVRLRLIRGQAELWLSALDSSYKAAGEADLAAALDLLKPDDHALRRRLIGLLWDLNPGLVRRQLDGLLSRLDLPAAERTWAVGRKAHLLVEEAQLAAAMKLLADELIRTPPGSRQDELELHLARVHYEGAVDQLHPASPADRERHLDEAFRYLEAVRLRRTPISGEEELDGQLHWLLGEVHYRQGRAEEAVRAFDLSARQYGKSGYQRAALLGKAKSYAMNWQVRDALSAYRQVVDDLISQPDNRLVDRQTVVQLLLGLYQDLRGERNYADAHGALALLDPLIGPHNRKPSRADLKEWQGTMLRNLALGEKEQAKRLAAERPGGGATATAPDFDETLLLSQAKRHLIAAAEAFQEAALEGSKDDGRGGRALQASAECYDEAGELGRNIVVLNKFIREHPADHQRVAWAIFNLAKACQATGQFEKAIEQFDRLITEFDKSPDANKAFVPMAQCYKALGQFDKAEAILLGLMGNDLVFRPDSQEFAEALFELARMDYERGNYRQAISRLDEALQRYPNYPQACYSRYYLADSYRRFGLQLDPQIASAKTPIERQRLGALRRQWLMQARVLFDDAVALLDGPRPAGSVEELDRAYLRNSYFFRADCLFELGDYEEAIRLYDQAAVKYQGQPEALAAYVQIVNCYQRLNRPEEARTANERARWLLRRLPESGFAARPLPLSREYYDQWLQWSEQVGTW